MIDTHAHLDALDEDPAEVVARAREAGVTRILTVGTAQAVELAERFDDVYAIVGVHPHEAATGDVDEIRRLQAHPKVIAVGEIGLDWYRDYAPADAQRYMFESQLGLAAELGKPVVIHTRAADDDTLRLLDTLAGGVRVILHCFSMAARVQECLAHEDWWLSFAGNVTYPKATQLREAALRVPADRLLSPVAHRQALKNFKIHSKTWGKCLSLKVGTLLDQTLVRKPF